MLTWKLNRLRFSFLFWDCPVCISVWVSKKSCSKKAERLWPSISHSRFTTEPFPHETSVGITKDALWETFNQPRDCQTVTHGPNLAHCLYYTAHKLRMVFTFLNVFLKIIWSMFSDMWKLCEVKFQCSQTQFYWAAAMLSFTYCLWLLLQCTTAAELSSIHRVQNMPPQNSHCLVLKQKAFANSQSGSSRSPSALWLANVSGQQDLFPWFKAVDKMYHLASSYGDPLHLLPQGQLNDTVEMGTQRPEPGGPPNSTAGSA